MGLYLDNGYLDFEPIFKSPVPYWFIIGARGIIGKTYGSLKYAKDHGYTIMYMRRMQGQADIATNPIYSPYKPINHDDGCNIQFRPANKYSCVIEEQDEEGNQLKILGYTCALSTIANLRSFDASTVDVLIFDEFVPEPHAKPIKEEAAALFNALETLGRNREIQGKPPLKMIALSNSDNVACPLFSELKLISVARRMQAKHLDLWQNPKRGISILIPQDPPLKDKKSQTALYRMTAGSKFSGMALDNVFGNDDFSNIASRPLNEYRALVKVGRLVIMRHKSQFGYYVTMHNVACAHYYEDTRTDLSRFRALYPWVYTAYLSRNIIFEDEQCEMLLREYIRA